jgi:hypothetical protein
VSRTSKTPTSIYLANRGVKTANIPLVPGVPLPPVIETLKHPLVVGLYASPERIVQIRQNRLLGLKAHRNDDKYIDQQSVAEEVSASRSAVTSGRKLLISGDPKRDLKAEQRAHAEGTRLQNYEKQWNEYLKNRETIIEGLRREIFDTTILAEYLDLQPGDLKSPVMKETNRFGSNRRPDWKAVAERLENAPSWWHALSHEQRAVLRSQTTLRQLAALKERQKQYG